MPTTFVVAAAWRGTGIGNSIYHAALWLTLTRQLDAHVKFAQCTEAIIAPVASSFSSLAQLRAGTRVRYTHCCGAH